MPVVREDVPSWLQVGDAHARSVSAAVEAAATVSDRPVASAPRDP
jgi:hypothetical protein